MTTNLVAPGSSVISPATSPGNSQIRTEDPKLPEPETPSPVVSNTSDSTTVVADPTDVTGASSHTQAKGRGRVADPPRPAHMPLQHDPIICDTPHVDLTQILAQGTPPPPHPSGPSGIRPRLYLTTPVPLDFRNSDSPGTDFYTPDGSGEIVGRKPFDSAIPIQVIYSRSVSRPGGVAGPFSRVIGVHQQRKPMHQFPTRPTPVSPNDSKTTESLPTNSLLETSSVITPNTNAVPPERISGASVSNTLGHKPGPGPRSRAPERRDAGPSREATAFPRRNGKRVMPPWSDVGGQEGDDRSFRTTSTGYVSISGEGDEYFREETSTPVSATGSVV